MQNHFPFPELRWLACALALAACSGESTSSAPDTCPACRVASYTCSRTSLESYNFVPSGATLSGCKSAVYPGSELHCEPLEICGPKGCIPVTETDGVLQWEDPGAGTVTCYPD
jgi:hypothetical protein